MEIGPVERYLKSRIEEEGAIHITLIDPEDSPPARASELAQMAEEAGSSAIMVGGSTAVETSAIDDVVKAIKENSKLPVILFPGNVSGISKYADAIWFMSLLNSTDPYFLIGAQALGAPLVKKYGIEPIPMGYIVVGGESAVGFIGYARSIPENKPELAAIYALAGEYLGMRFVYLEAGSGAPKPIPPTMVYAVRKLCSIPIIVGGGIRSPDSAEELVRAGANVVVTGTLVEESEDAKLAIEAIVSRISRGRR